MSRINGSVFLHVVYRLLFTMLLASFIARIFTHSKSTALVMNQSSLTSLLGKPPDPVSPMPISKKSKLTGKMRYRFCRLSWTQFEMLSMVAVTIYQNGTGRVHWQLICFVILALLNGIRDVLRRR